MTQAPSNTPSAKKTEETDEEDTLESDWEQIMGEKPDKDGSETPETWDYETPATNRTNQRNERQMEMKRVKLQGWGWVDAKKLVTPDELKILESCQEDNKLVIRKIIQDRITGKLHIYIYTYIYIHLQI